MKISSMDSKFPNLAKVNILNNSVNHIRRNSKTSILSENNNNKSHLSFDTPKYSNQLSSPSKISKRQLEEDFADMFINYENQNINTNNNNNSNVQSNNNSSLMHQNFISNNQLKPQNNSLMTSFERYSPMMRSCGSQNNIINDDEHAQGINSNNNKNRKRLSILSTTSNHIFNQRKYSLNAQQSMMIIQSQASSRSSFRLMKRDSVDSLQDQLFKIQDEKSCLSQVHSEFSLESHKQQPILSKFYQSPLRDEISDISDHSESSDDSEYYSDEEYNQKIIRFYNTQEKRPSMFRLIPLKQDSSLSQMKEEEQESDDQQQQIIENQEIINNNNDQYQQKQLNQQELKKQFNQESIKQEEPNETDNNNNNNNQFQFQFQQQQSSQFQNNNNNFYFQNQALQDRKNRFVDLKGHFDSITEEQQSQIQETTCLSDENRKMSQSLTDKEFFKRNSSKRSTYQSLNEKYYETNPLTEDFGNIEITEEDNDNDYKDDANYFKDIGDNIFGNVTKTKIEKQPEIKEEIQTQHVTTNLMNEFIKFLIDKYSRLRCMKNRKYIQYRTFEKKCCMNCIYCEDFKYIKKIKQTSTNKKIQQFKDFWQKNKRFRLSCEYFLINIAPSKFLNKRDEIRLKTDSKSLPSKGEHMMFVFHALPVYLWGNRNIEAFNRIKL